MSKVPVWHGRAGKLVWEERKQWHTHACQPGRYEIDDPLADPLNLPPESREMRQRYNESDRWYDQSLCHLGEQEQENTLMEKYFGFSDLGAIGTAFHKPKGESKPGYCGPDDPAERKAMIDAWLKEHGNTTKRTRATNAA